MTIYRSVRAVAGASGQGIVDWDAVVDAATASTEPGDIDLSDAEQQAYATDVRDARERVRAATTHEFVVPDAIEIQNRHHWIEANVDTFRRIMEPLEGLADDTLVPGAARVANTGTMSVMLGFLGRNVLGQYDPLLLADAPQDAHGLYFVHPNVESVASELGVPYPRFRRWIAFHEVTHAAEFGAAPWLTDHLEARMEAGVEAISEGRVDRELFAELQTAMTAVEGYAELLMDEAFDEPSEDLRDALDERRASAGPVGKLFRRALGLDVKREQYERGREFFEAVVDASDLETAGLVWDRPENLPTDEEFDDPQRWLQRVAR